MKDSILLDCFDYRLAMTQVEDVPERECQVSIGVFEVAGFSDAAIFDGEIEDVGEVILYLLVCHVQSMSDDVRHSEIDGILPIEELLHGE